ncbi:MAG: hypothetical protein M1812_000204 [Candelaria pacifica]|nr:MAG: hypothetical protein M1812_000204 [Candelaria pacifica]
MSSTHWKGMLRKQLTYPNGCQAAKTEKIVNPAGSATRKSIGTMIIETFHDIDLDALTEKPSGKRSTADQPDYAKQLHDEAAVYTIILKGHTYIALDFKSRRILAMFQNGLRDVWGVQGTEVLDTAISNINEYLEFAPPSAPSNGRHSSIHAWREQNPHLEHCGSYHWGYWCAVGRADLGPKLSKDIIGTSAGLFEKVQLLLQSFQSISIAVAMLFNAVDHESCQAYKTEFQQIPQVVRKDFATLDDDLFSLRVLPINLWTEPHRDTKDWKQDWAWICPMGEYAGGDFCITELNRRIPFSSGSIAGLRGGTLEHWTTHWKGFRFSLVHAFHDIVKQRCQPSPST